MGGSVERTMANCGYIVTLNVTRQADRGAVRAPQNGMERLQRGNLNLYEPSPYDNERLTNKS